jgi:hypothetical protein
LATFYESMIEYRNQLRQGAIQIAYKGLMEYIMELRTHFQKKYPDYFVSGSIYFGYMDMTYFSFYPQSLHQRNLKVAIVFIHQAFRFEAWLAGSNKQVQLKYWKLFTESAWDKYHLVPSTHGVDSIVESVLVDHPDFGDLATLTNQIETESLVFIQDIESFLSNH